MEILEKIISLQKHKETEIKMYESRIEEVKEKGLINLRLLEEKTNILSSKTAYLNKIRSKTMDKKSICKSLDKKTDNLNNKCMQIAENIDIEMKRFEEMAKIAKTLKDEYEQLLKEREEKENNVKEINKAMINDKEKQKEEKRETLHNIEKKAAELNNIISSMKKSTTSELNVKRMNANAQKKILKAQIKEIDAKNKELFIRLSNLEKEKQDAVIIARKEYKKLEMEKEKNDAAIKEEYNLAIHHLKTKAHYLESNLKSLQNKKFLNKDRLVIVDDMFSDSKEYINSLEKRKAQYALKLGKLQKNIKTLHEIQNFLKKEEFRISTRINEFVSMNANESAKWKDMENEVNLFEKSKNELILKQEERTSAMRNKKINAKSILENCSLLIRSLSCKYEDAQDQLSRANSGYAKYKTMSSSLSERNDELTRKISQLRIEKRNIAIHARPLITAPFKPQPQEDSFEIESSTNDSTHSTLDFDSFGSSIHAPLIEDLAPLDSMVTSINTNRQSATSVTLSFRADIQEIKNTLESMLLEVNKERQYVASLKEEGTEYANLVEENKCLKKKKEKLKRMNEEITLIRTGKMIFDDGKKKFI